MSALVVDTSAWIDWMAGDSPVVDEALDSGRIRLPVLVAAELLGGRLEPSQRGELEDLLASLTPGGVEIAHWFRVGVLVARLVENGLPVSTRDAHVAQCALDVEGELLSGEAVFAHMARFVPLKLASPGPAAHVH